MRKLLHLTVCILLSISCFLISCKNEPIFQSVQHISALIGDDHDEDENEEYDGPAQRDSLEFEKTKDPSLGYVPSQRLEYAIDFTETQKSQSAMMRFSPLTWTERGPIYDSIGPSNGNGRGGPGGQTFPNTYTSGRIRAVLIDTLNDPSGNTVFAGGVSGGLWRCTNFMSTTAAPNWQVINDRFNNLAIAYVCQDPSSPSTMYFATGEATSNADAVYGLGVWKSTDKGLTWSQLPSTVSYRRNFRIICDASGNVYLAARTQGGPLGNNFFVEQPYGLLRSKDKGATWQNITPANLTSSNAICTDIEFTSTGRLHAAFGYTGSVVNHVYTTTPATVTPTTGWNFSTGIRSIANAGSVAPVYRMELDAIADTLYAVTVSSNSSSVDSCYKSINGGVTWTKQNSTIYTTALSNGQGWYNLTLSINPENTHEILIGGLDAYRSVNDGQTITRRTFWVSTAPYVHADHHFMQWWKSGTESRVLIGCDGGLFLSRDGSATFRDRNQNLGIKQFYDAAIHPAAGSPYLIAGAQDNGTHQLKNAGLSYSTEVTGGDGCFVHINKKDPQVQWGSYVYNQYRRSTNGGQTWSSINYSGSAGMFVNPYDYDDDKNIMYAAWTSGSIFRWINANTSTTADLITIPGMSTASAFKVSPNTPDRLFFGSNAGKVYRLDKANTETGATLATNLKDITGSTFPAGFVNCVNVGSNDNFIVAVFSNYGVNNVWYSSNGGTSWTAIDGNLPDMPVRWAIFHPQFNNRILIATETGVYSTDAVNGSNTVWNIDASFPTVRTDALELRTSDNTVVAATHGRGLFTAVIPTTTTPEINFVNVGTTVTEKTTSTIGCRGYTDYTVDLSILLAPSSDATVKINLQAGGTAVRGVDYDFTTNGDFTTPSDVITFAAGATTGKQLQVRIYDDAEVESTETFTLDFGITGTSNATKGLNGTHTITINDNDFAPTISAVQNFNIGVYNSDIYVLSPFTGNRVKHRVQHLYRADELKAAGILKGGTINSLTLKVVVKNSTRPFLGFTISLATTTAQTVGNFTVNPLTQVYTGDYITVVGNNTFNFSTPFVWDGVSNIVVQYCYDNGSATGSTDLYPDGVEGNVYPFGVGFKASAYANFATGNTSSGCALLASFISDQRPNVSLGFNFGETPIASALNTTKTEYLNLNNDLYYYSGTGEVIARVKSLSAQNYGCTQITIDRAGTGSSQFWNTTPANYLMNKTFQIVPTTNSATGKYEVTFYYTKAEKEGWEAATGQSWNNIMLIKVPSKISNVTPLNAQPDGPGTVQIITPVRGTLGSGFTLTGTFDNGFSGFGAGIPGRINTILTLTGSLDNNLRDINVNWTTSAEMDTKNFILEKSYDGVTFFRVYTVNASGTKFTPSTYSYVDREYVQMNYYRVTLFFNDNTSQVSNTIFVKNDNVPQRLIVLGNPFSNNVNIRLSRVSTSPLDFSVYDMQGRLVKKYVAAPGSLSVSIDANSLIAKGVYQLRVYIDNYVFYRTLLKQ